MFRQIDNAVAFSAVMLMLSGRARHYCNLVRQSAHNSPLFLVRLLIHPIANGCESRLSLTETSISSPYAMSVLKQKRQYLILHPDASSTNRKRSAAPVAVWIENTALEERDPADYYTECSE
jgi:hypothetical protein